MIAFVLKGVSPYNHWLQNVYLSDLAVENRFPPISFLFRRSVYDKIGGFDEELPVLGDWDFNLKVAYGRGMYMFFPTFWLIIIFELISRKVIFTGTL